MVVIIIHTVGEIMIGINSIDESVSKIDVKDIKTNSAYCLFYEKIL